MVKMGSSALNIWGDQLNEWDVIKSLAKVVEILEKSYLMIFDLHQY